jgi:transcriptional regulator with XRE-family HTH domain
LTCCTIPTAACATSGSRTAIAGRKRATAWARRSKTCPGCTAPSRCGSCARARLTGAELRFLRTELDISQKRLAEILCVEEQTVSLWERRGRMPKLADRFVRALFRELTEGNARIEEIVARLTAKDRAAHNARRAEFACRADEWRAAA